MAKVKADSSAIKEEEDEVVATYDVFAADQLKGSCQVFQFPLRPIDRPYEMSRVKFTATKGVLNPAGGANMSGNSSAVPTFQAPEGDGLFHSSSRFAMDIELDTIGSQSFRQRPAESGTYGLDDEKQAPFKYRLESVPFNRRSQYVVAVKHGNEIHLTPVCGIQQFTPSVTHRNKEAVDEQLSRVVGSNNVGGAVQSTLDRQLKRLRSTVLANDAATAEEWDYFPNVSVESKTVGQRLFAPTMTSSIPATGAKRVDPADAFFPREKESDPGGVIHKQLLSRYASLFTTRQQVADLLQSCRVVHLSLLLEHVKSPIGDTASAADIVAVLKEMAVYMHGVWVTAKDEQFLSVQKSDAPRLIPFGAALREFILMEFQKSVDGTLSRHDVNARLGTNRALIDTAKTILESVAVLQKSEDPAKRRWKLRFVDECASSKRKMEAEFAETVATQDKLWKQRFDHINQNLSLILVGKDTKQLRLTAAAPSGSDATARVPSRASAPVDQLDASQRQKLHDASKNTIRQMFMAHGVLNRNVAKEHLRSLTRGPARSPLNGCPDAVLVDVMKSELMPFTDSTWILKSGANEALARYRPFIILALRENHQFTAVEIAKKATEKWHRELERVGQVTDNVAISVDIATEVVREFADYSVGERLWHVKNGMAKLGVS